MEPYVLDPEQEAAVQRMADEPTRAALNASQYGTGKTLVSIELAKRIDAKVILIAAPLFTKYSWRESILRQYPNENIQFINSTKSGKEAYTNFKASVPGWYIIGREYLASRNIRDDVVSFSHKIDIIIYDECAKWANRKSIGAKMMHKMKPGYRMALSATPAGNRFSGMWTITRWLWPDTVPRSFWRWVAEWAVVKEDHFAGTTVEGEQIPGAYANSLPCYVRLEKDFGTVEEFTLTVQLSKAERKIYDTFNHYLIVWLQENPLVAKLPATKRVRLRQMTLGEVTINPDTDAVEFDENLKSTKYDALKGLVEEIPDEPMVVFTHSQKFAKVVTQRLVNDGYKAVEWSGSISERVRQENKVKFINGEIDYIVATPGSIGEGTDGLQHRARIMVWLSRDDNNMLNMQAYRRLHRRGQERQVISIDIEAEDTYDKGQLETLVQHQIAMNATLKKEAK